MNKKIILFILILIGILNTIISVYGLIFRNIDILYLTEFVMFSLMIVTIIFGILFGYKILDSKKDKLKCLLWFSFLIIFLGWGIYARNGVYNEYTKSSIENSEYYLAYFSKHEVITLPANFFPSILFYFNLKGKLVK